MSVYDIKIKFMQTLCLCNAYAIYTIPNPSRRNSHAAWHVGIGSFKFLISLIIQTRV